MAELDVLDVVEICAGAGGQALGLERAGFEHALAVELDSSACGTLRANRPAWKVAEGDVADRDLWRPEDYRGVALLAGGVPCPPFTVAGRQLARDGIEMAEIDIEQDEAAAEYVMSVNGGNQTVPTVVFPDGTALTNPSAAQVKAQLAAIAG